MCIRDRNNREEFRPIIDGITIGLQALLIFIGLLTLGIGGAVSYTHLRAHETVLDLVCRLLLEKKKIQKSNVYTPLVNLI